MFVLVRPGGNSVSKTLFPAGQRDITLDHSIRTVQLETGNCAVTPVTGCKDPGLRPTSLAQPHASRSPPDARPLKSSAITAQVIPSVSARPGPYTDGMTQKEQRERLGRNDLDLEDALIDEAANTVTEGAKRLNRK